MRKRRRLNVDKGFKNDQNSYVLKLYDRSVDLAKFSPHTSLYPVCRAWIKNQPNNQQLGSTRQSFYKTENRLFKNIFFNSSSSPTKVEDKGAESKEDISKIEETSETDVNNLPLPKAMPIEEEGQMIDTRIPLELKPPRKSKSTDFLNPKVTAEIYMSLQ